MRLLVIILLSCFISCTNDVDRAFAKLENIDPQTLELSSKFDDFILSLDTLTNNKDNLIEETFDKGRFTLNEEKGLELLELYLTDSIWMVDVVLFKDSQEFKVYYSNGQKKEYCYHSVVKVDEFANMGFPENTTQYGYCVKGFEDYTGYASLKEHVVKELSNKNTWTIQKHTRLANGSRIIFELHYLKGEL